MQRRAYLASLGSASVVGLSGCTALAEEYLGGEAYDVGMARKEFLPAEHEVTTGETVVWKNTSSADHTVTALESSLPAEATYFASGEYEDEATARDAWHDSRGGAISPRETFAHRFEIPGTYDYICEPHVGGGMIGTIVVTE